MALIAIGRQAAQFPGRAAVPLRELPRMTWEALPALLMPVILLGCLYSGVDHADRGRRRRRRATRCWSPPCSTAAMSWRDVYNSLLSSARVTVSIGMLIAGAMVFNYVITVENIPKTLSAMLKAYELSPFVFLLLVNVLLLILGCVLEGTTIILVIVPVLLPTAQALGIDLVHFGVMVVVNIMIGLVLAALRPAALHDGQDHGRAAEGHRARDDAVPRRHDRRARADHLRAVAHAVFCPG